MERDLRAAFAHRGVRVVAEMAGGHRNRVFLVEPGVERGVNHGGRQLVAKTTVRDEAALRWLFALQALARAAGLIVPELLGDSAGRLAPGGMTLEPFIAGGVPGQAEMREVGCALARVHRLGRHLPQRPGFAAAVALGSRGKGAMSILPRCLGLSPSPAAALGRPCLGCR